MIGARDAFANIDVRALAFPHNVCLVQDEVLFHVKLNKWSARMGR